MKFLHNISRIEAFSDVVFAFAATLLVVSVGYEESESVIKINWRVFLGFGVSFFVLVALCWLHYNFYRRTNYMNSWIIAINAILLFVMLYYVFPLKTLINSMTGQQRLNLDEISSLFQLYSLGFLLIFLCFTLLYYIAYRNTKSTQRNYDLNLLRKALCYLYSRGPYFNFYSQNSTRIKLGVFGYYLYAIWPLVLSTRCTIQ